MRWDYIVVGDSPIALLVSKFLSFRKGRKVACIREGARPDEPHAFPFLIPFPYGMIKGLPSWCVVKPAGTSFIFDLNGRPKDIPLSVRELPTSIFFTLKEKTAFTKAMILNRPLDETIRYMEALSVPLGTDLFSSNLVKWFKKGFIWERGLWFFGTVVDNSASIYFTEILTREQPKFLRRSKCIKGVKVSGYTFEAEKYVIMSTRSSISTECVLFLPKKKLSEAGGVVILPTFFGAFLENISSEFKTVGSHPVLFMGKLDFDAIFEAFPELKDTKSYTWTLKPIGWEQWKGYEDKDRPENLIVLGGKEHAGKGFAGLLKALSCLE